MYYADDTIFFSVKEYIDTVYTQKKQCHQNNIYAYIHMYVCIYVCTYSSYICVYIYILLMTQG